WLAVVLDERGQDFQGVGTDDELVMLGPDPFGDAARVMEFGEVLLVEADGEGLDGRRTLLGHERHDRARINSARQERAERHFRHQAHAHRVAQKFERSLARLLLRDFYFLREVGLPVALDLYLAVGLQGERVAGLQLAYVAVGRLRRGHAHEGEVVVYGLAVDFAPDRRVHEERRELRAEQKRSADLRVEQRLFADAVAREEELLSARVPDGEGEHAAQVTGAV